MLAYTSRTTIGFQEFDLLSKYRAKCLLISNGTRLLISTRVYSDLFIVHIDLLVRQAILIDYNVIYKAKKGAKIAGYYF